MPTTRKAIADPSSLPTILEKLTAAVPELRRRFKVARIGVFGSYARGQEAAGSDLDVLVDFAERWRYSDLFDLQEHLNALPGTKVDVVPREGLKPYIGRRILAEVVWIDDPSDARRALAVIRERPASRRPEREIRGANLHDLRETADFRDCLDADSYVASQTLAERLLGARSLGVVYPSVRRVSGTCLACFRPALVTNVRRGRTYRYSWKGKPEPAVTLER